ncbi:hypothetical protein GS982_02340 [Rhodococcus hoagii]|uniref:Uncharacterized protein n=1 Tax=Rhodococcus hoagii TaxID=43767 RepID=A0A9Q2PPZ7_RHOHA|nr:hypothetical protein [Prescottella equi]MBM4567638.1 hypothetical protein [Prescottella equi]MBM4596006.1 hypothetical protein [Prescottella equi]MCU7531364.1 hypothetical protein [Prescottella equi]MCU7537129.1 hypothetical protein [Prescottella equi]NKT71789.1 hypothetical protein [Prescottella equi]
MTDTITPASLRAHADWFDTTFEPGSVEARSLRNCAARLEAESARDEEAERLAKVQHMAADDFMSGFVTWDELSDSAQAAYRVGMRAVLDRLAADGRLLPEGGTGEAACLVCGRDAPPRELTTWRDADGEGHWVHPECDPTTPAVPAPDSGPDGTPEKPWPTWQDVPKGVKYRSRYSHRWGRMAFMNVNGEQHWIDSHDRTWRTFHNDADHVDLAPFVRVDGDKA